jgi:ribonuclease HI
MKAFPIVWRPPTTGFIKINVDAAVSQSRTTLAAVARNDKGEVLGIWAKADCVEEHEVAEAKAVLWALQMAMEEDYSRVIVEGDAKGIMDPLQQPLNPVNWTISSILGDVHSIAAYFLNCNSQWIRRGGNNFALTIAKFASSLSYFVCNAENIPQVILQAWQLDVLSFSIQ